MKIKLEAVVDAMKVIIEAGNEKEFKKFAKDNGLFIIANKDVVLQTRKRMTRSGVKRKRSSAVRLAAADTLPECDDCRFV